MCLGVSGENWWKFIRKWTWNCPRARPISAAFIKNICLAYTPEAQVGDYVLVHVGFAISRIDEAEAQEIFSIP